MGWGLQCVEDMNDCKTVRRWKFSLWGFSVEGVSGRSCLLCNFALMCSGVLLCRIVSRTCGNKCSRIILVYFSSLGEGREK